MGIMLFTENLSIRRNEKKNVRNFFCVFILFGWCLRLFVFQESGVSIFGHSSLKTMKLIILCHSIDSQSFSSISVLLFDPRAGHKNLQPHSIGPIYKRTMYSTLPFLTFMEVYLFNSLRRSIHYKHSDTGKLTHRLQIYSMDMLNCRWSWDIVYYRRPRLPLVVLVHVKSQFDWCRLLLRLKSVVLADSERWKWAIHLAGEAEHQDTKTSYLRCIWWHFLMVNDGVYRSV